MLFRFRSHLARLRPQLYRPPLDVSYLSTSINDTAHQFDQFPILKYVKRKTDERANLLKQVRQPVCCLTTVRLSDLHRFPMTGLARKTSRLSSASGSWTL